MNVKWCLPFIMMIFLLGGLFLSGCQQYLFETPQPTGVRNSIEFPKSFQGSWKTDNSVVIIGKNSFSISTTTVRKVLNRITRDTIPRDSEKPPGKPKPERIESIQTIRYDAEKKSSDTITDFILERNKIYVVEHGGLSFGSPYKMVGDTIVFTRKENFEFELGSYAFLRKIGPEQYILNFKENREMGNDLWWHIILAEKTANGHLVFSYPGDAITKKQGLIDFSNKKYGKSNFYFDSQWTITEIQQLIKEGVFSDTLQDLDERHKIH